MQPACMPCAAAAEFEAADKAKEDGEAELTFAAEDLDR